MALAVLALPILTAGAYQAHHGSSLPAEQARTVLSEGGTGLGLGRAGVGAPPLSESPQRTQGDCIDECAYWQGKAVKRLAGWNRANHKILRLRAHLRRALRRPSWGDSWLSEAFCIHGFESTDWRQRGHHFGGMQFNIGTWASVGGRGNPAAAPPVEQLYRAYLVWARDRGTWREWSTAPLCGLH